MPKWQINSVVRQVMAERSQVTFDDIQTLEAEIRRKETGLPGSKVSLGAFKKIDIRRGLANGLKSSNANSPLATNASRFIHQKRSSINSQPNVDSRDVSPNIRINQSSMSNLQNDRDGAVSQKPSGSDYLHEEISLLKQNPYSYNGRQSGSQSYVPNKTIKGDNFLVGILPNMGPNASQEVTSLLAYGSGKGGVSIDSSLVHTKAQRGHRFLEDLNHKPQPRSSLTKQFVNEVGAPSQ